MIARPKPNNSSCRCQASQPPAGCQSPTAPFKAISQSGIASNARQTPARNNGRKARRNTGTMAIAVRRSSTCIKPLLYLAADLTRVRSRRIEFRGNHPVMTRHCLCRTSSLPDNNGGKLPAYCPSGLARAVPCPRGETAAPAHKGPGSLPHGGDPQENGLNDKMMVI
ncbi:hypothetical protein D3C78_1258440 [compost metagenome]